MQAQTITPLAPAALDWPALLAPEGAKSPLVFRSSPERVARRCAGLVYLSAPYLGDASQREQWRMERAVRASMLAAVEVARLAALDCTAVAPAITIAEIAHAGLLMPEPLDPLHLHFWVEWSQPILNAAKAVVVPAIDGWDRCPLVWRNVQFALERNIPVHVYAKPPRAHEVAPA